MNISLRMVLALSFLLLLAPLAAAADLPELTGEPDDMADQVADAIRANRDDFAFCLEVMRLGMETINDENALENLGRTLRNMFRGASPADLYDWATAQFPPAGAPAEPDQARRELERLLDELDDRAQRPERIALIGSRAHWFPGEARDTWANMMGSEAGGLDRLDMVRWFTGLPAARGGRAPRNDDAWGPVPDDNRPDEPVPDDNRPEEPADAGPAKAAGDQGEPYEGFGVNPGGKGKRTVNVSDARQLTKALNDGNAIIMVSGEIDLGGGGIRAKGSNLTLDGGGRTTFWGNSNHSERMLELYGQNLILRNFRVRGSGDNLGFKSPANHIMISHVSTTGAHDDGLSLAYGTQNATVQYCAFFGCTRSMFIKYDEPTNISIHHCFFRCQWMRGPKVCGARNVDLRNIVQEDWGMWGARFEAGSNGNAINNIFVLTGASPGKPHAALYGYKSPGEIYFNGNVGRGCTPETHGDRPMPAPRVTTHSVEEAERIVRERAGCMPRDNIDEQYVNARRWSVSASSPFLIRN